MNSELTAFDADAYGMAVAAKEFQGSIDYLKGVSKQLTEKVAGYATLPTVKPLRNGLRVEMRPRRIVVKPHERRSLDRAELRKQYPDIYAKAVTVTPPPRKYGVRLDVQRGLKLRKSQEWSLIAEAAAGKTQAEFDRQFAGENWRLKTTNTMALYLVKERLRVLDGKAERARVALAEYIENEGLPRQLRGLTDGLITATLLGDTYALDYDVVEGTPAARLISTSPNRGWTTVDYVPVVDTYDPEGDDEPFEGD